MLVKLAIKTAIASALIAALFQEANNISHLAYPAMGLITTMQSSFGGTVKKAWGRLGGSLIGGAVGAWLVVTLGAGPATAGLAFILTALICSTFQFEAPYSQAGIIAAMLAAQVFGADDPWFYAFTRVMDNWIGIMTGLVVLLVFWPDYPQQSLSSHLAETFDQIDQLVQRIITSYRTGERQQEEETRLMEDISGHIQASKTILSQEMYGMIGSDLAQENWSDRLAAVDRIHRHLSTMLKALQAIETNSLRHEFSAILAPLAQQMSETCQELRAVARSLEFPHSPFTRLGLTRPNSRPLPVSHSSLPFLSQSLQEITEQVTQLRSSRALYQYPIAEIRQFYAFLHSLKGFIQAMEDASAALLHPQKKPPKPGIGTFFTLNPVSPDRIRQILKTGFAVWLCLVVFNDWFQLPFNYYAIITVIVAMQPTFGKVVVAGTQRVIVTGIGGLYAILLISTLGSTPFTLGLGIALIILTCSYLGFSQGYATGCILLILSILAHSNEPAFYIWERFLETLIGAIITLLLSQMFWPNTSSRQLDEGIASTLRQMGKLYTQLLDSFLHPPAAGESMQNSLGMNEISVLNDGIKQAIQSHIALQQETQQEQVYSLTAPQKQREWNVLLTYETIFSQNLEILQEVVQEGRGDIFPDELQQALQKSVQITVLNFNQLASSLEQSNFPPKILSSLTTVNLIEQALNTLRASGAALTYSLDEMIPLTVVISSMRDMNDNISQLGNDLRKV